MFTVALIGADGAGKTTVARGVVRALSLPAQYVYMGINLETSTLVLPTTRILLELKRMRGGRPDMTDAHVTMRERPQPYGTMKSTVAGIKSGLKLAVWLSEEWFRQLVVWYYQYRGYVIVFDRHFFFDYSTQHIARDTSERSLSSRLHGIILEQFYPRPDLVICLDAPAEVLFQRKRESTLDFLECRRQEYLRVCDTVEQVAVVDATKPPDIVIEEVVDRIYDFYERM